MVEKTPGLGLAVLVACSAPKEPTLSHHVEPKRAPNVSALDLIDQTCRLLAAKRYSAAAFVAQIGSDPTRELPPQHIFGGGRDEARVVPPSPAFSELFVTSSRVDDELFNQITLTVAENVTITVGALRKRFPSKPRFGMIHDAFDIQSLILERTMPGTQVKCQLVATVPTTLTDLDAVTVRDITIQE